MSIKQIIVATVAVVLMIGVASSLPAAALECSMLPKDICESAEEGELEDSGVWKLIIWVINIMTVGVGIAAVGAIAFAGFLYTTARDDAGQTKKAIEMIRNTIIGLIAYVFMYAALQYLIPGGVFGLADAVLAQGGYYAG